MMLDSKEKAIIAGFKTWDGAKQAEEALRNLDVMDLRIDRISEHPVTDYDTEVTTNGDGCGSNRGHSR